MSRREEILALLDQQGIPYWVYEHERVHTLEECLKLPFATRNVMFCKNILLCNRQKTAFYLMLLRPETAFRTAAVSKALGVSRLSFAPEAELMRLLQLTSGAVNPLSLYFDTARQITLCYEPEICDTPKIAFHPCDNSATVVLEQQTFWRELLPLLKVTPVKVDCGLPAE